jgi:hypothetical protein
VQTFMPYADICKSAQVLDNKRLGKQRVETFQILRTLTGITSGWANHPATKMWRNHTNALVLYGVAICDEWISRGYNDTCREKILRLSNPAAHTSFPSWWGEPSLHKSHQSNLIRKDPFWYLQYKWNVRADLPYEWPICKCDRCTGRR